MTICSNLEIYLQLTISFPTLFHNPTDMSIWHFFPKFVLCFCLWFCFCFFFINLKDTFLYYVNQINFAIMQRHKNRNNNSMWKAYIQQYNNAVLQRFAKINGRKIVQAIKTLKNVFTKINLFTFKSVAFWALQLKSDKMWLYLISMYFYIYNFICSCFINI